MVVNMEDFVPYELAVKLKEKGFNAEPKYSLGYYDKLGNFMSAKDHWFLDGWIIAPTISQVLKWLREKKKIHICISYDDVCIYSYDIVNIIDCEFKGVDYDYKSYELAALAGVNYCLDNLI